MKKLLALAAVVGGALFVVKRKRSTKNDLWRESTAPSGDTTSTTVTEPGKGTGTSA